MGTNRAATNVRNERTFRSGPYLEGLFGPAAVDAYLEQQICARIRQARKEAGFTQDDMAGLLDVTLRAYQNYERNRVPFRRMGDIARITNRSESWLLHGDPPVPAGDLEMVREELARLQAKVDELLRRSEPAPPAAEEQR